MRRVCRTEVAGIAIQTTSRFSRDHSRPNRVGVVVCDPYQGAGRRGASTWLRTLPRSPHRTDGTGAAPAAAASAWRHAPTRLASAETRVADKHQVEDGASDATGHTNWHGTFRGLGPRTRIRKPHLPRSHATAAFARRPRDNHNCQASQAPPSRSLLGQPRSGYRKSTVRQR